MGVKLIFINLIKQQKNVSLKLNLPFYVLLFKTRLLDYLKLPMVEKHMDAHGEQGVGEELGEWTRNKHEAPHL